MRILSVAAVILFVLGGLIGQNLSPEVKSEDKPPVVAHLTTEQFINQKLYPATVLLYQQTSDGSLSFNCTATAIFHSKDSYLFATAAHCLEHNPAPYVNGDEHGEKTFIKVDYTFCGKPLEGVDVCIIRVHTKKHFEVVPLGEDPKGVGGTPILSIASPLGIGKAVFHGYVVSTRLDRPLANKRVNWKDAMVLQLPGTNPGASGAAVICEDQQAVCGITVGIISTPTGQMTVAMPISRLATLILSDD